MARITIDDCLQHVDNQFDLVLIAAKRARRLANGAEAMLEWENDKPTVMALREIAAGLITKAILEEPEQAPEDLLLVAEAEQLLAAPPPPLTDMLP
jgi:DNA-directed RNA polymerase subunit omega